MQDKKKAIPTKAGTAQFTNVTTTYKTNFITNKPLRTAIHINIAGNDLSLFVIKETNKIGMPFIDAVTHFNQCKQEAKMVFTNSIGTLFLTAMADAGLEPHHSLTIEADGQLKRFRVKGDKPGSKNGWYVLFNDGLAAGSFGNWKMGFTANWSAKNANKMSKKERYKIGLQRQNAMRMREQQRIQEQHNTAVKCGELWNNANPLVEASHPYLVKKQSKSYGIRQLGDKLLIPVQDAQNHLVSLQFIMPDGSKKFKAGGRVKGCFMVIGELEGTVFICEGYATGATIHQATKQGVIVAFNAGNLSPVITALQAQGRDHLKIIIVADNDSSNRVNTGLIKAEECARRHNISCIYPTFTEQQKGSDFNDLACLIGFDKVGRYLIEAMGDVDL